MELPEIVFDGATAVQDWVIVLPIVLSLMGAALALMMRGMRGAGFVVALAVVLAVVACDALLLARVVQDGPVSMTMGKWLPPFGISLAADVFGAAFALLASLVTLAVLVYARAESGSQDGEGFHALLLLLLAGVSGAFLTGDLFNLYVWFEVMLIASFGLIILGGRPIQIDGAVKYGFLNFLATSFFLLALGLTYGLLGTLNMADILRLAPLANPAALAGIAALLLLAFGMKAAAFPVNAWLPAAYHTPSVAVSALFAGLLTKVGTYALLRSLVVLLPESRDLLEPALVVMAIGTLLLGPLGAMAETDLRRALGFFVIGGIGAVLAGIAMPSQEGVSGAGFYIFHAMLTMTGFYLVAGLVERRTGQRDTRQMGGLYAASAPLSLLFFALVLAVAGIPPLLGFWPKLLLIEAGIGMGGWSGWGLTLALLANASLTLIAGTRLWAHIFWRPAPDGALPAMPWPRGEAVLRFGAAGVLVLAVVAAGLWPNGFFVLATEGAAGFIDPQPYVAAIGLAGAAP